jgi:uncharacterized sporulation protein YeaH/YhbH (DUF444 family)
MAVQQIRKIPGEMRPGQEHAMTSTIIDRRPQQGKSSANRQRVLRRLNKVLKHQVDQLVSKRRLTDVDTAAEVTVGKLDVSEPNFRIDQGTGASDRILPGNDRYRVGDRLRKPEGGGQGDGGDAGEGGGEPGEDNFRFILSREEFLNLLFDDLELPELLKKELTEVTDRKFRRGGIVRHGNPGNMSVLRTFRASIGRRVAAAGSIQEDLDRVEYSQGYAQEVGDEKLAQALALEADAVRRRATQVPFIDPVDLRHRSLVEVEAPRTAAVMFCLMDVSGSMSELRKDLAKRFFTLLYMFLTRKYENVELVFIRHTEVAEEVDENTFFYDPLSGGTKVLAALEKMKEIIEERFPPARYNIFGAQASDGDSIGQDPAQSRAFLTNQLLPLSRYFVYAETNEFARSNTELWNAYTSVERENFNMAAVPNRAAVYPALVKLFEKERVTASHS